jgi:tetraacyldisaccharide 4'-kinase
MNIARLLLYPFAILYDVVTSVRNRMYDLSLKPSASFDIPVIGVGNLSVGGTGKSPMIEHLIRRLADRYRIATLSRGYMRSTKGFRVAGSDDSPSTVGDEPFQFYRKFKDKVIVSVGEERAMAIPQIVHEFPDVEVILLDDAYQHRRVKPSFQILLTDYHHLFYKDALLPAGRLRESKRGADRADIVVVTKCPEHLSEEEMMQIETKISMYSNKPVFFATIRYADPVPMNLGKPFDNPVVLVSGLADPTSLERYVRANFRLVHHVRFPDHHAYQRSDIDAIVEVAKKENASVITTEKDSVKIMTFDLNSFGQVPFFYLPIEIDFIKNGKEFDEMVLNAVAHAWK